MTEDEKKIVAKALLNSVPPDGSTIGNKSLLFELRSSLDFAITDDDYWAVRNELIQDGKLEKGKGKGGSVYLVLATTPTLTEPKNKLKKNESELYRGFLISIEKGWLKNEEIESGYVVQLTANQGSKKTGGKWTRPDVTVIAAKSYPFIPGKVLEVITFEVKREDDWSVNAVFETASHSVFATRSYLALHMPNGAPESADYTRLIELCENFGIGLLTFADEADWDTYQNDISARRNNPDPGQTSKFIQQQISEQNKSKISEYLKGF